MSALYDLSVVNGVEIETELKDGKNIFPTLYKIDKLERVSIWRIYVVNDEYHRESGIEGGAVKKYQSVKATPKNVGKSNETTPHRQALFEAFSEWKHKLDQLYSPVHPREEREAETSTPNEKLRPMLAEKYTEKKQHIKYPCGVSPKLDGVRCMIYLNEEDVVILSRQGKVYNFMNNLRQEAKELIQSFDYPVVLDGELYSHNLPFNAISGVARTKNNPSKYDDKIEYHIFDLYIPSKPNSPFCERLKLLQRMSEARRGRYLHFVSCEEVKEESCFMEKHKEYVEQGYEGLMIRNLSSPYLLGRRSKDLLKYKEFLDEEFVVVDVVEGVGTEQGAAVFVCKYKDTTFSVRPRGSIEKRRLQFKNKKKFIGKKLTVRYQPLSKDDVLPRFPVGIKFDKEADLVAVGLRDYE